MAIRHYVICDLGSVFKLKAPADSHRALPRGEYGWLLLMEDLAIDIRPEFFERL